MSDDDDHGAPGRSLLAEMTTLRKEMESLRKALGLMVDLQRDMHTKLDAVLSINPITDGKESTPVKVV